MSRCRKFESIIDGTVDRCDFSDDTYSEDSDGDDDIDGTEDYEEEDEDNDDEYENDYEPFRKRKKN